MRPVVRRPIALRLGQLAVRAEPEAAGVEGALAAVAQRLHKGLVVETALADSAGVKMTVRSFSKQF